MWDVLLTTFADRHQLPDQMRPALDELIRQALALTALAHSTPPDLATTLARPRPLVSDDAPTVTHDGTVAALGTGRLPLQSSPEQTALPPRYEDLGAIGHGGMGDVRRVRDRTLHCTLAMKIVQDHLVPDPIALSRFIEEAQITAQLQHPGIVPLHELGVLADGRPYFTMREVQGRTIGAVTHEVHAATRAAASGRAEWHAGASGWTFRRLVDALHRVCETVAFAHAHGVIHRDLKPGNVMVGDFGEVLVLDWGIAKVLGAAGGSDADLRSYRASREQLATRAGSVAGTPAYMPVEQATGDHARVGRASDVYSLGVMLYELISGELPYEGSSVAYVVMAEPRPLRELAPVDDELKQICARAMARDADDRYADAGAMAAELATWLDGSRRREQALAVVGEAEALKPAMAQRISEAEAMDAEAKAQLQQIPPFAPVDVKKPAWALQDGAAQHWREVQIKELGYLQTLRAALTLVPDLPEAHALLAAHHQERHAEAEAEGNELVAMQREVQLRAHDDGRWATYLRGDGAVSLDTDPVHVDVDLYVYEEVDRRLVPKFMRALPRTPIRELALPMGSYLLRLSAPEHEPIHYPVVIRRLQHWDGRGPDGTPHPVPLPRKGELGPDEVYVAPGWYASGGDPLARNSLARRDVWIDGFVTTRFPITVEQYLEFLNDLVARGELDELSRHLPPAPAWEESRSEDERNEQEFGRGKDGRVVLARGDLRWPITMVNWFSAAAYGEWRAARTGLPWRMINELEREKASRGVDGRHFPWGRYLDPTFCHMRHSHVGVGRALKASVDGCPVDESPYGVRGMGGNVRDWCRDAFQPEGPRIVDGRPILSNGEGLQGPGAGGVHRICRGGSWLDPDFMCRTAFRDSPPAIYRDTMISFRCVRSFPAPR